MSANATCAFAAKGRSLLIVGRHRRGAGLHRLHIRGVPGLPGVEGADPTFVKNRAVADPIAELVLPHLVEGLPDVGVVVCEIEAQELSLVAGAQDDARRLLRGRGGG